MDARKRSLTARCYAPNILQIENINLESAASLGKQRNLARRKLALSFVIIPKVGFEQVVSGQLFLATN
ncbi:hypothetical protein [Pseudomonas sp. 25 E 4]|nr:hypothetical protein [Pseudomonas sp. 25 E 4]